MDTQEASAPSATALLVDDRPYDGAGHGPTSPRRAAAWTAPAASLALAAVILLVRARQRWTHPTFFAEDGQIFLSQAKVTGSHAFVEPYNGYLHAIPRLCAFLTSALPLQDAAGANVAMALVLMLVLTSPLLSRRLSWLIPSPWLRGAVFVGVQLMAAQDETSANVANLVFIGGITLVALALSDPPRTVAGRVAEAVGALLLGLSGPIVVVVAPLFLVRLLRGGKAGVVRDLPLYGALAAAAVIQLGFYESSDRMTNGGGSVRLFVRVLMQRLAGSWTVGETSARDFYGEHHILAVTLFSLWLVLVLLVAVRTVPVVTGPMLAVVGLGLGSATWAYGTVLVVTTGDQRHEVVPTTLVLVALAAGVGKLDAARWVRGLALVLLATFAGGATASFALADYTVRTDTGSLQACLRTDAPQCATPISPGSGWNLVVRQR